MTSYNKMSGNDWWKRRQVGCSNWKRTPADGSCSRWDEDERRRWRPSKSATQTTWSRYGRDGIL